jgi:hypothetical protein
MNNIYWHVRSFPRHVNEHATTCASGEYDMLKLDTSIAVFNVPNKQTTDLAH